MTVSGAVVGPERQLPVGHERHGARPRPRAGRGGMCGRGAVVSRAWAPPTPSSAASSGVPSASSRPSSTAWPTCWWRWSRSPRWPGTPPRPPTPATRPRPGCRPCWPGPSPSTPTCECAKACIQILGGMGFTWEHDAHLHLRRALTLRQLVGPSSALAGRGDARRPATAAGAGSRSISPRTPSACGTRCAPWWPRWPPPPTRRSVAGALVDTGLLTPHWPVPWGRGAGPVEQLVIDEELAAAHVHRPHLAVGAWALPTIIAHGTDGAAGALGRAHDAGRARVVPALQRARRGQRPRRPVHARPRATTGAGCSTGRRCGRRSPCAPTGGSVWPAAIPTRPSTRASPTSSSTCTPRASRCDRCARSRGRPCSTRCSSPTSSCPTTAWWAR